MTHLCLDTCTWIYLANGFEPGKLISYLYEEIKRENIRIILPELIIEEWQRNSSTAVNNAVDQTFKGSVEGLKKIQQLIEKSSNKEEEQALQLLLTSLNTKEEYIKKIARENILLIELIFNHSSTIITKYSQANINLATKFALDKLAPFANQNSMADALIFLQMIEYLKTNNISGAYFITWNSKDFFPKKTLSPNLDELLKSVNGKFFSSLAFAIHSITQEVLTTEELKEIERKKLELEEYGCLDCALHRSRWSPISFENSYRIVDERDSFDPNQLSIFVEYQKPKNKPEFIKAGSCGYCGSVHIKCPTCDELMGFPYQYSFNEIYNCECCGMKFVFNSVHDRKGEIEIQEFIILDNKRQCAGCINELDYRNESDLCDECEKRYAYDS